MSAETESAEKQRTYSGTSREHCVQGINHGNAQTQREVYSLLQERGSMTCREIANEIGVRITGARTVLQRLQRDGYVEKRPNITNPGKPLYEVVKNE